jgi:hypothetical protein
MENGILPIPLPNQAAAKVSQTSPENPMLGTPEDQWMQLNLSQEDIDQTVAIVSMYRNQWGTDRLLRQRTWMKSNLFYRGVQVLDWHDGSNSWIDSLNWYRGSDKTRDGETTGLDRFLHPLTLMLGQTFIGNMAREVPLTVVKPQDARVLADLTTAEAGSDAIGIIERRNKIRQMIRDEFEILYLYGTYFKYTRGALDSQFAGFDMAPVLGEIPIDQPAKMRCFNCGKATPVDQLEPPAEGQLPHCPNCGTSMGPEGYEEGGPGTTAIGVVGMRKIPRAMVRQTIHSPLEVDADPQARELCQTPILAFDTEIDIGEARMMFPNAWDKIHEGAAASTTANADYDRLRRNESYSFGTGWTTDNDMQRPTYSQVWVQPMAYHRKEDKEYIARMMAAAPEGLKLTMLGSEVVGCKKAILTKEWTVGRLRENFGLYSISIAENVVNFNERFNSAMQLYDDYMMRAAPGLNLVDASRIDTDKWKGNTLSPSSVVPVPMRMGGQQLSLREAFCHFDIPINPGLALYPQMLWMFAQLLNGLPAQIAGQGTNPDVGTYGGQQLQVSGANTGLAPFFENVKEEHAAAAQNALECLQELLKCGAATEIWDVVLDEGSQFRNNYVNLEKMRGRVKVYPDEDQDLPQTPEEIRRSFETLMTELGTSNPAAQRIFDLPSNQLVIGKVLYPGVESPIQSQYAQTLQDINVLLEKQAEPVMNQDGSIGTKLPVQPSVLWDFSTVIPTIQEFMIANADLRYKNPVGWSQVEQYYGACQDMQTTQGVRKAALEQKVRAAGAPPQQGPDPGTQAAIAELHKLAVGMADQLAKLSQVDPSATKGTLTAQVAAAKEVIDAGVNVAKIQAGGR